MKNQYMFFNEQQFEGFDLSGFEKKDICIPNTNVHIYEFVCVEGEECSDDETRARMLDGLSQRLQQTYPDSFQTINSESSQFFCGQLYPLVVGFETKLRYALYISRALFENGNVNIESFKFDIDKSRKPIEEIDFGGIYDAVFTDKDLRPNLMKQYSSQLTKAELIRRLQEIEENTIWHNIVGIEYDYIEKHFLEIKDFRNDVMHNHLITGERFDTAREILQKAVAELDRAVSDKLIVNKSTYLNDVNVFDMLSGMVRAMTLFAMKLNQFSNSDYAENMRNMVAHLGKKMARNMILLSGDIIQDDQNNETEEAVEPDADSTSSEQEENKNA